MTATANASINYLIQQITIYYGIPVYFIGIIGSILIIIVFLTSRIIRQKSCVFYLAMMSLFDFGRLAINTLSNLLLWAFEIDLRLSSLFYCKLSTFMFSIFSLSSITCLLLAVIDQYFVTCSSSYWQKWPNIERAHRFTKIFLIIYTIHGIPYFIFYDHIISPATSRTICQITNKKFIKYHTYGYFLILTNFLPFLTALFGLLTYRNVRLLTRCENPVFPHKLDKQLTKMILIQILVYFCTTLPYTIQSIYALITFKNNEPNFQAQIKFKTIITLQFSTLSYTVREFLLLCSNCSSSIFQTPFYIYVCVSKYFRNQLKWVLCNINFTEPRPSLLTPDEEKLAEQLKIVVRH